MAVSIADLAQYMPTRSIDYYQLAYEICDEYLHEKATVIETDIHDRWAVVRFADQSELIVNDDGKMRPYNKNAVF